MLSKAVVLALLFALIASPATYKVTSGLLGSWVANGNGCASQQGVLLHAAVFVAVLYALWAWRRTSSYDDMETYAAGTRLRDAGNGHIFVATKKWKLNKYSDKWEQLYWDSGNRMWVWLDSFTQKLMDRA